MFILILILFQLVVNGLNIQRESYDLLLKPSECDEQCQKTNSEVLDSQLITKKTIDLTETIQFPIVSVENGCEETNFEIPSSRWVGFLRCDTSCPISKQITLMKPHNPYALAIYGADDCVHETEPFYNSNIPLLYLPHDLTLGNQNWFVLFTVDEEDSSINWLALRLVLGFIGVIVLVTALTLWWIKPWRRAQRSRIYSVSSNYNPKSSLSKERLDVFPILNYEPSLRRKTTAACRASKPHNQISLGRNSLPNLSYYEEPESPSLTNFELEEKHQSITHPSSPITSTEPRYYRDSTCAICLSDYEAGESLRILSCHHAFHTQCIDPWLLSPTASSVCPTCKSDLSLELGLPSPSEQSLGPVIRFEEVLGIAMPVLIYPENHPHSRHS